MESLSDLTARSMNAEDAAFFLKTRILQSPKVKAILKKQIIDYGSMEIVEDMINHGHLWTDVAADYSYSSEVDACRLIHLCQFMTDEEIVKNSLVLHDDVFRTVLLTELFHRNLSIAFSDIQTYFDVIFEDVTFNEPLDRALVQKMFDSVLEEDQKKYIILSLIKVRGQANIVGNLPVYDVTITLSEILEAMRFRSLQICLSDLMFFLTHHTFLSLSCYSFKLKMEQEGNLPMVLLMESLVNVLFPVDDDDEDPIPGQLIDPEESIFVDE